MAPTLPSVASIKTQNCSVPSPPSVLTSVLDAINSPRRSMLASGDAYVDLFQLQVRVLTCLFCADTFPLSSHPCSVSTVVHSSLSSELEATYLASICLSSRREAPLHAFGTASCLMASLHCWRFVWRNCGASWIFSSSLRRPRHRCVFTWKFKKKTP